jgi:DNA-binding IclR family transcriptional regulator
MCARLSATSRLTSGTAAFYVRKGDRHICLYRTHGIHQVRHHLDDGASLPLDRGAGGHVLRAYTDGDDERSRRVRADGFHCSDGERDPETAAVGVPVFGKSERFIGALAAIGTRTRLAGGHHLQIRDVLVDHAAKLGIELGSRRRHLAHTRITLGQRLPSSPPSLSAYSVSTSRISR